MFVPVRVEGVVLDPESKTPVVMLRELDGDRRLPVWVGVFEAAAIVFAIDKETPERPLTHDLLKLTIEELDARVERVEISSLEEGVFHANLYLQGAGGVTRLIDCRPSDAVALALRVEAPIFAASEVLDDVGMVAADGEDAPEHDEEYWKKYLENLDSSAFGKYKM